MQIKILSANGQDDYRPCYIKFVNADTYHYFSNDSAMILYKEDW